MATIKSYSDLQQSRKLAEILPLESADMYYTAGLNVNGKHYYKTPYIMERKEDLNEYTFPCWSLASLLGVLPAECECMSLEHINYGNNHKKYFMSYVGGGNTDIYDNPVDACVAMIEKLHELKML